MSSQGTILARVYTSGAQLPLSGVPVSFAQVLPMGHCLSHLGHLGSTPRQSYASF